MPLILALTTAAVGAAVLLGVGNPLRTVIVLSFLAFGPGLSLVPLLRIGGWNGLILALGLSLALDLVVSTAMIYLAIWSPDGTFLVLVILSLVGAITQIAIGWIRPSIPGRTAVVIDNFWTTANRAIVFNAGSLVGTTAVTAGLGFVYWLVAARAFSPGAVGLASAAISAMTLLGFVGVLGLGTLLMGELPRQPDRASSLIMSALVASGLAGGVLGLVFALVASSLSGQLRLPHIGIGTAVLFALGVATTSASLVLDQAFIGMFLGGMQFARNALFAAAKLAALVLISAVAAQKTGIAIYTTWLVGNLLSMAAVAVIGSGQGWLRLSVPPQWAAFQGLRRAAAGHHALNLSLQLPLLTLPIVVTATLSAAFNAYFYVAWMVALSLVWVPPHALSMVLYTVGSKSPTAVGRIVRFTLGLSLLASGVTAGTLQLAADPVLHLFGSAYALHAGATLRILVLAVFPIIIKDHYVGICRIERRLGQAVALVAGGAVLELAGAVVGAHLGGLAGLSVGWAAMVCIEALIMAPTVYRAAAAPARHQGAEFFPRAGTDRAGARHA
jgi:O-antigen/teichoic acid export membrane protein